MAIPDWHDDDTDDEDDVLLGVVVSPAVRSPRRPSGTATRDRSASSLVSTLGNAAGLYGGSVLGFHERNAGTTAFSPFSPIARTAGGAPTPGPGRISLAGGGSPRVARLRLDDGDEDGDSTGGRLDGGNEGDAGERGDRGARASPSGLPGPSRGLGIGGARASIPPRSPSAAWPPRRASTSPPGTRPISWAWMGSRSTRTPRRWRTETRGFARCHSRATSSTSARRRVAPPPRNERACGRKRWSSSWDGRWSRSRAQTRNSRGSRTNSRGPSRGRTPRPPRRREGGAATAGRDGREVAREGRGGAGRARGGCRRVGEAAARRRGGGAGGEARRGGEETSGRGRRRRQEGRGRGQGEEGEGGRGGQGEEGEGGRGCRSGEASGGGAPHRRRHRPETPLGIRAEDPGRRRGV